MGVLRVLGRSVVRGAFKVAGLDSPYRAKGYGPNWSKQREKALERDDYTCRVCGVESAELDRELSVHHIRPRREFNGNWEQNELANLITVCPSCHGKVEGEWTDCNPDEFVQRAQEPFN